MNETNYDYSFYKNYSRIETSVFKLKDTQKILDVINTGRLKNFITFESFGMITYDEDDIKLEYAHVTKMDKFNRLRTNVMIFNVRQSDWNNGVYDKLYIIKQNNDKNPTFSYIFQNTETNVCSMMPAIDYEFDRLAQNLTKSFNIIKKKEMFDYYSRKRDAAHEARIGDIPTDVEGQKIIRKFYDHVLETVKTKQFV